jgi:hypothetical protein
MKLSRPFVVLGFLILATGVLAIGRLNSSIQLPRVVGKTSMNDVRAKRLQTPQNISDVPTTKPESIPKYVVYGLLFREITAFQKTAERLEREGKEASLFRHYHKEKAGLNDKQDEILLRIASEYQTKLNALDLRAKEVIDRDHKRYPDGLLKKGQPLPAVPKELSELEEERRSTILEARDRLQIEFGDEDFARFDEFEQAEIEAKTKPVNSTSPSLPFQLGLKRP